MARLNEILPDIFSLEINTIVKDQMSAQKMPSLPHALHDILRTYAQKLASQGVDLRPFFDRARIKEAEDRDEATRTTASGQRKRKPDLSGIFDRSLLRRPAAEFSFSEVKNGWISFEIIRLIAVYLQESSPSAQDQILERIRRNCDQLTYILRTLWLNPRPRLDPWQRVWSWVRQERFLNWREVLNKTRTELLEDNLRAGRLSTGNIGTGDFSRIRKIWEMGTEHVIVQTVIQIDGDVVTRLGKDLYGRFAPRRESLLEAHRQSVDVSLAHWQGLARLAVDLVRSSVRGFPKG